MGSSLIRPLKAHDFYLLRMPLLSCEEVLRLHRSTFNDPVSFVAAIRQHFTLPLLQEAVFLASPALYTEMLKWLKEPDSSLKLPLALYRYLLRMSARCTPYGLFAGCTTGTIGPGDTHLTSPDAHHRYKVARLDMEYLSALMDELVTWPDIRSQLDFFPNNSLYNAGPSSRYYEYQLRNDKRHYFLSEFLQRDYIREILAAARQGARIAYLVEVLHRYDISEKEAAAFIENLIHNQILVAHLAPVVSGEDNLAHLIGQLPEGHAAVATLQRVRQLLQTQTDGAQRYLEIQSLLQVQFPNVAVKDPVQVDLFFPSLQHHLSAKAVELLLPQLERLQVLGSRSTPADLQTFKERFLQMYEQREIPLMTALDSESGIGYGIVSGDNASYTPLIDDLVMPAGEKKGTANWNEHTKFVLKHFLLTQSGRHKEITLTDADLDELSAATEVPSLPANLCLMGALLAADADAFDKGDFRFLFKSCYGPNAIALLGRFAAGDDTLKVKLKAMVQREQLLEPDKVFAEIVHLPEGRTGNVLLRPDLYEYEIPFLGKSGKPEVYQLPVNDLYVTVRDNRVILCSARLGKEVVPRLTSAHNYTRGLSVYKFLCDLQQQEAVSIQWNWGLLLDQPFLPRVVYKQIIIERARWKITQAAFQALQPLHTAVVALQLLKDQYEIPDTVLLSEGDNELLIDFSSVFAIGILAEKLKRGDIVLYEHLFNADTRLLASDSGAFCNEVIIPLHNTAYQPVAARPGAPAATFVQRSFSPGSEWLYAKIYCGPKWMDRLLLRELMPLTTQLEEVGMVDRWFFIRFQDPDHHIRIRFHLPQPAQHTSEVIGLLGKVLTPYLDNDVVQKVQFDTYIRELERYGPQQIMITEKIFFHDSQAVTRLLAIDTGPAATERWLLALKGADALLDDFGYTPAMKLQLLRHLQQQFFAEHKGDADLLQQLNNKYRQDTPLITAILRDNGHVPTLVEKSRDVFSRRSVATRKLVEELKAQQADAVMALPPHYLHMFLNRMFAANARLHELVIYHYLMKYYTSEVARGG
ncbi:thiopeptide-type bacteriocin biosynthesis protein [Chitinophaga polysaccharea]|uniref:Thiopeptide-type bacteriocin biosynthesis protein n=1 Tax=Chitinophaga polysaccharea TaxID=1293035 RepID=A0A561Q5N7_9BACT|nr:lantibiotic dehydratase [Chitinophaga polysaccharea]TWF45684.1 thiopeptide-type bacteriocin biosynthesis protein [Chitinophaga polysaccharea]